MNTIREIFDGALHSIERSDALGRGASGRLVVAKELANKLEPPGRSLNQISHEFAASVSMVDPAQNHILDVLDVDEKQRSESTEYLDSLIVLAGQAKVGMLSMLEFADTTHEARNWSKDLRKPIDTIEAGVRRIADTQAYFVEWANRATRIKEGLLSDSVDT
jgi:hypothetical protein